ncbi:hypothetical protein ACCS72_38900, partial [Rhizobium ruizarguesonis]
MGASEGVECDAGWARSGDEVSDEVAAVRGDSWLFSDQVGRNAGAGWGEVKVRLDGGDDMG